MIKEKLEIANKLRNSSLYWSTNSTNKKLIKKCYQTYVIKCIFLGKTNFQLKFKGKHMQSFWERVSDWLNYINDNIKKYLCLVFIPKRFRPKKYPFVYYKIDKPYHPKLTNAPNEFILYSYFEENGLKIVGEHLFSVATVYDIALI